jgi:hypothetical protein
MENCNVWVVRVVVSDPPPGKNITQVIFPYLSKRHGPAADQILDS